MQNKLSLADLKAKAGKAFTDAESIKGGVLNACHIIYKPKPMPCDNI
ncbi:MAG: hypothetical protein U5L45_26560 [Saprospiraceae bacterium]|nr:hypothetical protein [Saprospiraceae bacterium]